MKRIAFIILFVAAIGKANAQQLQASSFYELQGLIYNPSFMGVDKYSTVGANYRTQWSGINGAPRTANVFGSFALPEQKLGIGGYVYSDKTGPTSRNGISLSIAKHIVFNDKSKFSFGIENRIQQFRIDQAKLAETLGTDPAIGNNNNSFKYDAGVGISYTNERLQIGASVAQLLQTKQNNYTGNLLRSQEARLYRHYYLNGSYKLTLDESSTLTPNFLIVYLPNATTEYNIGAKFRYQDIFSVGVATSATLNASFSVGLNITKNIAFDYAFDFYNNPSDNQNVNMNSHEFMLRYFFKK